MEDCIGYDYTACMDYMDPSVCCPKKAVKLNQSLFHSSALVIVLHLAIIMVFFNSGSVATCRSGLTLVQVVAWCLTAPCHFLNKCWLSLSDVLWYLSLGQIYWKCCRYHIDGLVRYCSLTLSHRYKHRCRGVGVGGGHSMDGILHCTEGVNSLLIQH